MDRPYELIEANDDEELQLLSETVRKFARAHVAVTSEESVGYRREIFDLMAKSGLTGAAISEALGGTAMSSLATSSIIFELSRVQLGPAIYLSVHYMVSRLIETWDRAGRHHPTLRDLAAGKSLGAFCLTEATAGSDAAALKTQATKLTDGYRIDGEKIYITSAGHADVYLVFARTGGEGKEGISAFVVAKDTPGISFGAHERKMGCEGAPIASIRFDNCIVPQSALLGDEGAGYKIALSGLSAGRISIGAAACGLASASLELATRYASERRQFGSAIAEFQGIQFMLADMYLRLRPALLLVRDAAHKLDRKAPGGEERLVSSAAKCFATDAAMFVTTEAVQIFGGAGYLKDYQVERFMRDAKMLQIVEGTNQIQRSLIARSILK